MVGPVDNRPYTNWLNLFEKKKTCDSWYVVGVEHFLKISAPQLLRFGNEGVLKIWRKRMTYRVNELMTKVFVEQLRLHRVC